MEYSPIQRYKTATVKSTTYDWNVSLFAENVFAEPIKHSPIERRQRPRSR